MKPSLKNTLEYAFKNVDFYKQDKYKKILSENRGKLDHILLSRLPIIDGNYFLNDFYRFIPSNPNSYIFDFETSGSSGTPKNIPVDVNFVNDYVTGVINIFNDILNGAPKFYINIAPPKPAISGVLMSRLVELVNGIEFVPGPGQRILDVLRNVYAVYSNHENMGKKVNIMAISSLLFREVYSLNKDELDELKNLTNSLDVYVLLAGEPVDFNRVKLLQKMFNTKGVIDLIGTTEGASGYRFYSYNNIINNNDPGYEFIMNDYNVHYSIFDGNKLLELNNKNVGEKGELTITQKSRKNKTICPLINYNMKELVIFRGFYKGKPKFEFIGRSNKLTNFSVSKLNDNIIDDVIAGAILNYDVGEGYAEITRENGLDKLLFHFYKKGFNGDKNSIKSFLENALSNHEMELSYVIKNKLGLIDIDITDKKEDIPFYVQKGKSIRLMDKRGIEHY